MDTSQRVVCLLSGGIDSPVAAAEIIKRAARRCSCISQQALYFRSHDPQSETPGAVAPQAQRLSLGALASAVASKCKKAVRDNCTERYRTVFYRRFMMKIRARAG